MTIIPVEEALLIDAFNALADEGHEPVEPGPNFNCNRCETMWRLAQALGGAPEHHRSAIAAIEVVSTEAGRAPARPV